MSKDQNRERDQQQNRADMRKAMTWAALAYGAFTALSVVGPIVLEKLRKRQKM